MTSSRWDRFDRRRLLTGAAAGLADVAPIVGASRRGSHAPGGDDRLRHMDDLERYVAAGVIPGGAGASGGSREAN